MQFVKPLQIQSYETLKAMVQNGQFDPEMIYSETKLSKELGISRTPVRDAIQRLAQEGYLDIIPSKGFRLHKMTQEDLTETYQIRCALEGFCAVQMAMNYQQRRTQRVIETLEELLEKQRQIMETTHSATEFTRYDWEFHENIIHYLGNESFISLYESVRYRIEDTAVRTLKMEGRMEVTLKEHQEILDHIRIGAVGRSYKSMLTHLDNTRNVFQAGHI
ncbi:MAG: GntR family transcriptional regulator [Lachnospiraceae bacterium]|nr:GntR family transcriptional regulator [Eubacterium sp.]MBR2842657.1 GntR family transcriptional regulator [Lachnospiraceae bacterium]